MATETHFTESGASPPASVSQARIERPGARNCHGKALREPVYLTPAQVAEILQVSPKTISRWALQDPSMPTLRRGRVLRFERDRLMAWLARHEPRAARR